MTHASHSGWLRFERAARDVGDEVGQFGLAAGRGQCGAAQVKVEIEVGIFDPHRRVEPERHLDDAPPQRRNEVQARLESGADLVVAEATGCRAGIENGDAEHVHVGSRCFKGEEGRVEAGETLHGSRC